MNKKELRATFSLAAILSIRMLGLFMILPVFALYADKFQGSTPLLIGLALGIYGLTQALFQMPFGILSDKIGRKPIIALGLLVFIVGSIIAATSTGIYGIILGRAVQGAGAIGSALIAFIADFTRSEHRTKAMAIMGITIGISFATAVVLGPLFNAWIKLAGIFWICVVLGILGFVILFALVPKAPDATFHRDAEPVPSQFFTILRSGQLLQLNAGIFTLHAILTASFVALPLLLGQALGLKPDEQWHLYLTILILSFIVMMPIITITEKKRKTKTVLLSAIACLAIAEIFFWKLSLLPRVVSVALFIFFTAFNLLEASLPSLVSRMAPTNSRGTAMGIYSTFQYLGIFVGGSLGGWILQSVGIDGVFAFCAILTGIWLLLAIFSPAIKSV